MAKYTSFRRRILSKKHPIGKEKTNPSKFIIWERILIITGAVAVLATLIFGIADRYDYKKLIKKTAYEKLYSDVSQGRYSGTKLRDAIKRILEHGDDLSGMNLSKKWLDGINLKGENLYAVNFSESTFHSYGKSSESEKLSDLSGANLRKANLKGAILTLVNFQKSKLRNANLQEAFLGGANLQEANLYKANLQEANLMVADFRGADLRETQYLTIKQLSKVKTLYNAKLDPDLMEQVKYKYPQLLNKPKSEAIIAEAEGQLKDMFVNSGASATPEFLTHTTSEFDNMYNRGAGEFVNGKYTDAIISFTKALDEEPESQAASYTHNYRGAAYGRLGKNEEALEEYNESVRLYPKNDLAYSNRGVIYYRRNQYEKAIEEFNKASVLYIIKGDYKKAVFNTIRALSLSPKIEDSAIPLYLDCVAKKKFNDEKTSECKTVFNENLKKVSTLSWSSDEIESWLKEAKMQKETYTFIEEMTDSIKKHLK